MSRTFTTVGRRRTGYAPRQVDEFFGRAREAYEGRLVAEEPVTAAGIGAVCFDLVHGGYATAEVDAALDRLEAVFVAREREALVASLGQTAWTEQLADRARTLYERLARPSGERFAPARRGQPAYDRRDVDELCDRLVAYFDRATSLTSAQVREATFRRRSGRRGYAEGPVDAFLARAVEVLLGVE